MKVVTIVVLALFLAVGLCAQQQPDGKPASVPDTAAQNSNTSVTRDSTVGILNDTQGIDFARYVSKVYERVRKNWYARIPAQARAPEMKSGTALVEFNVLKDGRIAEMKVATSSGEDHLDRAALESIAASAPFNRLPKQYKKSFLTLKFRFTYNPQKGTAENPKKDATR
jgi:TonB family protein